MADKEIRDNNGNIIGTISDRDNSGSGGFDTWEKWVFGLGAILGGLVGFSFGGLGGGIVGAIIGPLAARLFVGVLFEVWLPWIIFGGFIWLIIKLWGVGK